MTCRSSAPGSPATTSTAGCSVSTTCGRRSARRSSPGYRRAAWTTPSPRSRSSPAARCCRRVRRAPRLDDTDHHAAPPPPGPPESPGPAPETPTNPNSPPENPRRGPLPVRPRRRPPRSPLPRPRRRQPPRCRRRPPSRARPAGPCHDDTTPAARHRIAAAAQPAQCRTVPAGVRHRHHHGGAAHRGGQPGAGPALGPGHLHASPTWRCSAVRT